MKATIVIPTYNEKDNITPLVEQIFNTISSVNILIVDDNSPDGTGQIADQLAKDDPRINVLHRLYKEGLGKAYADAFGYLLRTDVDYIITMDADFSHDPKYLPDFLSQIEKYDVVIGSRYIKGISVLNWSLTRLILSVLANNYIRIITGLPIKDCTSGFVCYRRNALLEINFKNFASGSYVFPFELKYRLFKKRFSLVEIPIVFTERRTGLTKVSQRVVFEAFLAVLRLHFLRNTRRT